MMKIAILDDVQNSVKNLACFSLLHEHEVKIFTNSARGLGQLAVRLAPFDALVLIRERTVFSRALLQKLPKLKLISQTGKLSAHVDVAAAAELGITVTEGVGDPTAPAELTWALIMASMRKIPQYATHLRDGLWQTASVNPLYNTLGSVLKGKTLGVWGYGKIGQLVAGFGRAFGMQVLIFGREASQARAVADGYKVADSKRQFFMESDVLTLHLRLNEDTRGIVLDSDFLCMKPDALFVNTSRAELVAQGALLAAVLRGQSAALDVFESEPPAPDSPLLRCPHVLATPHLGYVEQASYEMYFRAAFQHILDYASTHPAGGCRT